jgi:iron-sulfur cluster repair protein YtfE (RIC family)
MSSPFEPLLEAHEEFQDLLLLHQEALVRGDLTDARDKMEELRESLAEHIWHEEEKILPVLERGGGWSRLGDPRFYREEHAKITSLVASLAQETAALDRHAPDLHRKIALLIGREQSLRTLLEHHDDRERRALYPDLERLTTPEQWPDLLEPPD